MKRRCICLFLTLSLLLSMTLPAAAAEIPGQQEAEILYALGLFRGVGTLRDGTPDFALERPLTRQEAVVMLVRLLGREDAALAGSWELPFTDVTDWARPYIGYAYSAGLTRGIGETQFGGESTVSATQYLTFVLRALGYSSDTDFRWDAAWEYTDALGLTGGEYTAEHPDTFLRGNAAVVSCRGLTADCKDGSGTLADRLVAEGALTQSAVETSGLLPDVYTQMARELLKTGYAPFWVERDQNKMVTVHTLPQEKRFAEYDAYSGTGETIEAAMADAFRDYAVQCLDGDYSNGYAGTISFGAGGAMTSEHTYAYILTDGKGTVIAYSVGVGKIEGDMQWYSSDYDSRAYMTELAKEFQKRLKNVKRVESTGAVVDGQCLYTFGELPKDTAYYSIEQTAYSTGYWNYLTDTADHLQTIREAIFTGRVEKYPIAETCVQAYPDEEWARFPYLNVLFIFWDESGNPVAYSPVSFRYR